MKKLRANRLLNPRQKEFWFARHGQTDWNIQNLYVGRKDVPLNGVGRSQALELAEIMSSTSINRVVSSPLLRACQTAQLVSARLQIPVDYLDELKECSLGSLEGKPEENPKFFEEWVSGSTAEGAEKYSDFRTRIERALDYIVSQNDDVLVIAHSAVFYAVCDILEVEYTGEIANALPIEIDG